MYSSNAQFKDYFQLHHDKIVEKINATIQFAIKDYDMVGPADFHQDRSLDKLRSGEYDKPWLEITITFTSAQTGKLR